MTLESKKTGRRQALLSGLATGAGAALALAAAQARGQESCGLRTPAQPAGPFYPLTRAADVDADMTQVDGFFAPARGEIIDLTIKVIDTACLPIAGATVDLWQACASGRYNHPEDGNTTAALDPYFQYQAIVKTGTDGTVRVRTVKPGAYPNDPSWVRPPHIHLRITAPGFKELTTQMYFAGEALNEVDLLLKRVPALERARLVVPFERPTTPRIPGINVPAGTFLVSLQKV